MIVLEEDLAKTGVENLKLIYTEVNVFGEVEEKMPKIEVLKLRKFANYVLEEQCKNKENWHFVLYYIVLYYIMLYYVILCYVTLYLTKKKKNETQGT